MKHSKFIELLNLYIDRQISPADAALLESEIQQNPERRKIYREYCQMQKACGLLAETFATEGAGDLNEMAPAPRRFAAITYLMGFAAAAACVALVVVKRPLWDRTAAHEAIVQTSPAINSAEPTLAAAEPARAVLQPAYPGIVREDQSDAAVAVAQHVPLDWMNHIQIQRVSSDYLRFEMVPEIQTHDLTLRSARPYPEKVETTAFIFAK
jgi:hypothetical protein